MSYRVACLVVLLPCRFTPQDLVINAFVVEDPSSGEITDLVSFYTLPSTILGNQDHSELRAAYSYYTGSACTGSFAEIDLPFSREHSSAPMPTCWL